ncbi:hypothetical protein ACFO0N_06105 [Halobium salinum]|uniref:Uncharacterized protein n=1 Tax=Halobium salinum TaxID=1364940 RepID=A0ABD5P9W6_9EURY|nr:hypothetical protein [Halobium salinum]
MLAAVALSLAVVSGAALTLTDLGVANSTTGFESTVATSAAGNATLDTSDGVTVVVLGDAEHDRDVERAVVEALRANLVEADVAADLRSAYDGPVLVVVPTEWALGWTPVSGEATAAWRVVYVQSGDLTQFGESTAGAGDFTTERLVERLSSGDVDTVALDGRTNFVVTGEFALTDATSGLLSLPYYDRHVVEAAAGATVDALLGV